MRGFLAIIVAGLSGFLGMVMATGAVFPSLFNGRFPTADFGEFAEASSNFEHFSAGLFVLSLLVAAAVFSRFLQARMSVLVFVGAPISAIAGIAAAAVSTLIYFHNTYS